MWTDGKKGVEKGMAKVNERGRKLSGQVIVCEKITPGLWII